MICQVCGHDHRLFVACREVVHSYPNRDNAGAADIERCGCIITLPKESSSMGQGAVAVAGYRMFWGGELNGGGGVSLTPVATSMLITLMA